MSERWFKFCGKLSVDSYIKGRQLHGYSNEEIFEMMRMSKVMHWDDLQLAYAKKKLEKEAKKKNE